MAVNSVDYMGPLTVADTNRAPTAAVWGNCPVLEIIESPRKGIHRFEDWTGISLPVTQTTQIGIQGGWKVFNTGTGNNAPVSAMQNGVEAGRLLRISLDTDNDSGSIAESYPGLYMTGLQGTSGKLWFEASVALNTLVTNGMGFMLGLAETELWTLATGVPFNGGDAITNAASFIGFRKGEDAIGAVDSVFSDRATAFTNIQSPAAVIGGAFTFVKLGMKYDPEDATRCVRFYVDGVECATALTRAALIAMTNLDVNALGVIMAVVADTAGTTAEFYCRWVRYAQLFPGETC